MATKEKQKRVTAASVVRAILGSSRVPTDEKIIEMVKQKTGSRKFDKSHLSWYKTQWKAGKWAKGKRQLIKQAQQKRRASGAKPGDVVEN